MEGTGMEEDVSVDYGVFFILLGLVMGIDD